jgi:hypothetical protein
MHKGVSHVLKPMKESVIKAMVFARVRRRKPAETIPKVKGDFVSRGTVM